mmetsp:Transcript_25682/g.85716  ORF Transcript_25682/g.85716 Transcript_25682/m.85716 type:complete len:174 (+) Transcript_25682:107-628(+)
MVWSHPKYVSSQRVSPSTVDGIFVMSAAAAASGSAGPFAGDTSAAGATSPAASSSAYYASASSGSASAIADPQHPHADGLLESVALLKKDQEGIRAHKENNCDSFEECSEENFPAQDKSPTAQRLRSCCSAADAAVCPCGYCGGGGWGCAGRTAGSECTTRQRRPAGALIKGR